jgi:predicted Zn-dependent protease
MWRPLVGIAIVISTALASIGCQTDNNWSVSKLLGWDDSKMPPGPKYPVANVQTAERVDNLGRRIVAQNTFIGIEPLFTAIGVPESVLFHRGPDQLFISEGLVNLCKSDTELAAILCSELGQMVAEKKAVRRVGSERDSFPDIALAGGSPVTTGVGIPDDPGRQAELAYQQRRPKPAPAIDPVDATKQARMLLTGAGFDPATLDQVQPLLKQSDRGANLRKQMSGSAPPPIWTP